MKKIAIITGATGGIGKEFTKAMCCEELDEIWALARNAQRLTELKAVDEQKIICIAVDISSREGLKKITRLLEAEKPEVRYLINNAGIGKMTSFTDFTADEVEHTIDLDCKAPLMLSLACIPYMVSGSKIMNVSSAASFQPTPYLNLYAASKVFLRYFSRALNVELSGTGIKTIAVCPSWIDTEMLTKEINGKRVRFPGMVTADAAVNKAMLDMKRGKDMSVCSLYVKCQHIFVKLIPQRLVMRLWMKGIRDYI